MRAAVQAQVAGAPRQMAGEAFKNVQILKNIPVDEFMGAMGLFSAAVSIDSLLGRAATAATSAAVLSSCHANTTSSFEPK